MRSFISILFALLFTGMVRAQSTTYSPDAILGDWMTVENNLKVHVYKDGDQYKATITWFDENGYKASMDKCTDDENPDPALRSRKIIGLQVLSGLQFDAADNYWDNGEIYDSNSGDTYDAVVYMNSANDITVKGYYLFEWMGRSLEFKRVSS